MCCSPRNAYADCKHTCEALYQGVLVCYVSCRIAVDMPMAGKTNSTPETCNAAFVAHLDTLIIGQMSLHALHLELVTQCYIFSVQSWRSYSISSMRLSNCIIAGNICPHLGNQKDSSRPEAARQVGSAYWGWQKPPNRLV